MIIFTNQPALSVEMIGIPAIRQFLFAIPANQNLKDYERHINTVIPTFIEKIKRTVTDKDRDGGFITIADEFDWSRAGFMEKLLSQAKSAFRDSSKNSMAKMAKDIPSFKEQIESKLTEEWFAQKAAVFTRVLKCRGVVPKNASKAKGLEEGCNWNRELASVLSHGFNTWANTHRATKKIMSQALRKGLDQLHQKVVALMNASTANLVTVEKSKRKWEPLREKVQIKLMKLMDEVEKLEKLMCESATIEFDQERNLISYITNDMYTDVFASEPEQKRPIPGKKKQYKRYVTPKIKFQKKTHGGAVLEPRPPFVDRLLKHFHTEFDEAMRKLLEENFAEIDELLECFSTNIRAEAPINYRVTPAGEAIRAELGELILKLEERAAELRSMLPQRVEPEHELSLVPFDGSGEEDGEEEGLSLIIDRLAKKKRAEAPSAAKPKTRRIKIEPA